MKRGRCPPVRRPAGPGFRAAAAAAALALGGCSSLGDVPGLSALTGNAAGPPPVLRLEGQAPAPLDELLARHLALGRVNRLAAGEPLQQGALERLLAATPQQARELLDTEGYFNATVQVERLQSAPGDAVALPQVRVRVEPGPRTLVRQVDIAVQGPLADSAATEPHARQAQAALTQDWLLQPGKPFRQDDWTRAKTAAMTGLRAQGYVQADWGATQARIDAATQQAALSATLQSGPLHRVGPLRVEGLKVHDAATVANIANLTPGAPATESLLLDFQERLQNADLFDRVSVSLEPDPADPASTPVVARLSERQLQEATFGLGIGANVGARGTVRHVHRRPFGQPWVARNAVDLAQKQQRWEGELSTQTLPRLYRNLVGGVLERVESETDLVRSARLRVGRAQDAPRISRLWFAELDHSTTTSALGRQRADAVSVQYHGVWRRLDDPLLPTRGQGWTGQFGLGHARSTPGGQGPFVRLYGRLDSYHPLGGGWYGQGRLELGQIVVRSNMRTPETLRFRAGGDESVRGYAYRSLTRVVGGVQVGSEVLFTASAEAARPILQRLPLLWGAVFVDVGRAARTWGELEPAWGYGAGLRYRSPVGPVKLDLAWGDEVQRLRLHLSVGVAF